jgi:signal transduction histidine kinase
MATAAYALAMIVAAILAAALHMPTGGVRFWQDGSSVVVATSQGVLARLAPEAPVIFEGGGQRLTQSARELASEFGPKGAFDEVQRWYADRDRLGAIVAAPGARMLIGATSTALKPYRRGFGELPIDVWLLLAEACGVGLVGIWLVVLRPNDLSARLFMTSALGIALAAFTGALADAREITANGTLLHWALTLNIVGSNIGPSALLGLFLVQPRRLVGPRTAFALVAVAAAWGVAVGLGLAPMTAYYGVLSAMTVAFVAVLIAQWLLSKGDPAGRAVVRWVGLTSLISSAALTAAMVAKQFAGGSSLGGDGLSIVPMFVVYGGIAFGVGRYRLFDLDRWAYRVVIGALAAAALLALDAGLILGLRIEARMALGLSVLVIGYLYFPLRARVWRWVAGGPSLSSGELFQLASAVAFLPAAAERRASWRSLLQKLFDPLDIAAADAPAAVVAVTAEGAALNIPAAANEGPLVLRYRNRGRLLFDSGQAALAGELVKFMHQAERTRDEYARGAAEERQRIARDLHDDVSGRLLTGLRHTDAGSIRDEVRAALADIRTILRGLSGEVLAISQVVANMRHETFERLEAAGIELDWPVQMAPAADPALEYLRYRNITSAHREVITNILRHAQARRVSVRYATQDGVFSLTVSDDGVGLPAELAGGQPGGRGLTNIRRRLREIGGDALLEDAAPGLRVRLTAAIPAGT